MQHPFVIDPFNATKIDPFFTTVVHLAHFDRFDQEGGIGSPTTDYDNRTTPNAVYPTHGQPNLGLLNDFADISHSLKKFGRGALRRDGSIVGSSSAVCNAHNDYKFGTFDFTIEFWVRVDAVGTDNLFDMRVAGASSATVDLFSNSTGSIAVFVSGVTRATSATGIFKANTWHNIAYCRVGVGSPTVYTGRLFLDGTVVASWADSINYNANAKIALGSDSNANNTHVSYDEVRVSNGLYGAGAGRYTANYTVQTTSFPDRGP